MTLEMKQLHFWNMHNQSKAIQTKALEQAIKDSVPDGVGSSHVSQGKTRWTPQWKDCVWWEKKQTMRLCFQGRCKFANHHHT
jgi:hypothetical protein